jgi:hypothetical protein
VYVDPDQDCTPSLAALDDRPSQDDAGSAGAPGPSAVLAEVVSPENGSVGPQAARHVVVRTVDGAAITRARLNGRDVTARLGRSGDGTWSGTLNPAEGVVVGENTLVVKAERGSEQWYATTSWVRTSGGQADLVETELDEDSMPLQVLVRHVGDEAVSTTFTLGGSDVPADHVSRELDTERVRLSASSGLRHGSNRLVVSAHTQSGAAQRVVETVRVDNRDPIAGAGPDQRVQVHERAMLDGSSSLPARGGSRADLDLEWEIVSAPPGSQAQVVDIDGAAPQFRPDRPGRFEVQLTVTEPGGRTSTDVATFTVDALPNAMIETLATSGGLPGIKIDSAWFCNDVGTDTTCLFNGNPSQDTTTVQLLVLDSEDLTVVDNRSYDPSSLADFENRIAMLGDNALVVITLASHQAAVDPRTVLHHRHQGHGRRQGLAQLRPRDRRKQGRQPGRVPQGLCRVHDGWRARGEPRLHVPRRGALRVPRGRRLQRRGATPAVRAQHADGDGDVHDHRARDVLLG